MKKLLFILSAILVSVMGWAQTNIDYPFTLNPYAYDLSIKSWDPTTRKLTVHFRLNSPPNLDDDGEKNTGHNTGIADGEPNGVQIYAVDQHGEEYRIGGLSRTQIVECLNNNSFEFTMDLSAGTTVDGKVAVKNLPIDEVLTWKVRVKGRKSRNTPVRVDNVRDANKRPRHPLGVAVGTNPYASNFGKILMTQAGCGANFVSPWTWLNDALKTNYTAFNGTQITSTPAVLEYSPQLKYQTLYRKYKQDNIDKSYFSSATYTEPHRVRISEDGRIFVSSYHSTAGAAILEYLGNNTFKTVVTWDASENVDQSNTPVTKHERFNRRIVDFDVKGSGEGLTILAAWVKPKGTLKTSGNNKIWYAQVQCYEYVVGRDGYNLHQTRGGNLVAQYDDYNPNATLPGLIYQGFYGTGSKVYDAGNLGFIGVSYGKGNNNPIWMKVDFAMANSFPAHILYFDNTGNTPTRPKKDVTMKSGGANSDAPYYDGTYYSGYYGGNALIATQDYLITAKGQGNGKIAFYQISNIGTSLPSPTYEISMPNISTAWYNGMAIDYANNLYVVSEFNGEVYTLPLSIPSGMVETPSTDKFTIPHFASNLAYAPTEGKNSYNFSFNVDVEPQTVQIRLYDSKDKMLAGGEDYTYYIPCTTVNKGSNSVEIGAIRGSANGKEITNQALPAGEYYWAISVTGQGGRTDVTPSSDNYCYIPERLSHDMDDTEMNRALANPNGLDLYRPFQGGMFNTICLPFKLDLTTLPANHPLKDATLKEYKGLQLQGGVGEEKVLELIFADVVGDVILANTPYLIQPKENYNSIIRFATPTLTNTTGNEVYGEDETNTYSISYQGVIPYKKSLAPTVVDGESLTLILVADNRLAVLTGAGDMYGFRGYFQLHQPLPRGMQTRITTSKGTTTNTTIVVDGKKVNVNKFLREGRVYIRMGESLYTVDGQLVK